MALDQASQTFTQQLAAAPGAKPLHEMTPTEARAMGAALAELAGEGPEMARVEDRVLQSGAGAFPVRLVVPRGEVQGIIVWYHGGGWVIGSIAESDTLTRKLAAATGCAVVNVDYRMAPEHRFPAAADDCYAAFEWAHANAPSIAGRDVPMLVGGDSAGGNLAAVVALRARDRKGPKLALQVLVYPVTDADFERPSYVAPENQLLLTKESMVWFWDHYAPQGVDRAQPDASPLKAADLAGLPPAVVVLAEHDVLRDEGEAYAARLRQAGVPVSIKQFDGQIHGFFTMVNILPGHEAGLDYVVTAINLALR
jgi:acetyl esterase